MYIVHQFFYDALTPNYTFRMVSNSQEMFIVYNKVLKVTCRPGRYYLIFFESFSPFMPFKDGGISLNIRSLSIVSNCKEKLKLKGT